LPCFCREWKKLQPPWDCLVEWRSLALAFQCSSWCVLVFPQDFFLSKGLDADLLEGTVFKAVRYFIIIFLYNRKRNFDF
jgi:hypothetical protein